MYIWRMYSWVHVQSGLLNYCKLELLLERYFKNSTVKLFFCVLWYDHSLRSICWQKYAVIKCFSFIFFSPFQRVPSHHSSIVAFASQNYPLLLITILSSSPQQHPFLLITAACSALLVTTAPSPSYHSSILSSSTQKHSLLLITKASSPRHHNSILSFSSQQHPPLLITSVFSHPHRTNMLSFASK
jgi:hypothetical protein